MAIRGSYPAGFGFELNQPHNLALAFVAGSGITFGRDVDIRAWLSEASERIEGQMSELSQSGWKYKGEEVDEKRVGEVERGNRD